MAEKTNVNNNSVGAAAMVFAAFAVVLLVAFFSYRGADVGRLGTLIGNFGGGPLFGFDGLSASVDGALIAGLIAVSWFGLGNFVASFISVSKGEEHSHVLKLAMKAALGAAIWSLIFFFLGIAGLYTSSAAIVAIVVGLGLAVFSFRRVREAKIESRVPEKPSRSDLLIVALIAIPLVLAFISSLAPPVAKDTLLYHFSLPKVFIAQHHMSFVDGNMNSYMALGTEMHIVWAILVGNLAGVQAGEAAGGAAIWMFFPVLLMAIFGWSRELGLDRRLSLIAVAIVATVPTIYHVSSSSYIDVAWALSIFLAVYSLCRWWRSPESGWLVFTALFLAAALAAKLLTVFAIAAFVLVIVFRARNAQNEEGTSVSKVLAGGIGSLIVAGIFGSASYIRTWIETGSPLFPFYLNLWPGKAPGWDAERASMLQALSAQYGGDRKTLLDYLLTPWNISVNAQPEIHANFDGVIGFAFLLGLPLIVWGIWKFDLKTEAKICAGVAMIMFLFWLTSSQQQRYLLPILPLLSIAIMASIDAISSKVRGLRTITIAGFAAAAFAGALVTTAWFLQKAPLRVAFGGETREAFAARNLDYLPYYLWLNSETAEEDKVWLVNMRRDTYYLERPYFSDYMIEDLTLQKMVSEAKDARELRAKTAAMGIKYLLIRHDFLLDYKVSPLVDDKKPRAENEAKLKAAKEFILDPVNTVRSDSKFSLVKVF
ncbi:MAG: glycosyltransferase family 39 protein [Acidobacteria bacterium]|nr:glycosyltransferase family 39 protein [Acidobacteriota bacterium]